MEVPLGSVVAVPVVVPSPGAGVDVGSVVVLPGSVVVLPGSVVVVPEPGSVAGGVDVSPGAEVVVSVGDDVVVPSEPVLAAGGVPVSVPVSAAAGYAAMPAPTSTASATAHLAAKRASNRLNWSLRATAIFPPTHSSAARLLSRSLFGRPLPLFQRGPLGRIHLGDHDEQVLKT